MSKPLPRCAIARPILPQPMMPSVAPKTSRPRSTAGPQVRHLPARTSRSPSAMRRAAAISSANARSAVASVSTPGVCPTAIPAAVAAAISMLSRPTARLLMTRSLGAAAIKAASTRSVTIVSSASAWRARRCSCAYGGGVARGQTSTIACWRSFAMASGAIARVTKTRGRILVIRGTVQMSSRVCYTPRM